MEKVFKDIVDKTKKCEENKDMFSLPHIENYNIAEKDNETNGAILLSRTYTVGDETENITVDYESKDKCRTFQINPDRNIVKITWKKDGKINKETVQTRDLIESEHTPHTYSNDTDKVTKYIVIKQVLTGGDKSQLLKTDKVVDQ